MIALSDLKHSLRLMDTGDAEVDNAQNILLQTYLDAAASYIQDAVGASENFCESEKNLSIYRVAVLALAGAYWQNPVAAATQSSAGVDLVLNNIVGQLRYRLGVGGEDDGTASQSSAAEPVDEAGSNG